MANSKREITGIVSKKQTFTAAPATQTTGGRSSFKAELNADLNLNSSFVSRTSNTSKTRTDQGSRMALLSKGIPSTQPNKSPTR